MRTNPMQCMRRQVTGLLVAAVAWSCGGDGPTGNDFSIQLTASPPSLTLEQGTSGTVTVTLVRGGGFSAPVTASVTGLPNGVTTSVSPSPLTGAITQATVTVTVGATVAPGTYTATVTATAAGVGSATATYQLTVTETPNYALSATPAALTVTAGTSDVTTVNIARTNFTGAVALTLDNPPAGITPAFAPASATGNTSTLTLSVAASVAPGPYQVTIKGSATGPGDRTTVLALTVLPVPTYTLSLAPPALTIQAGTSDVTTVNIARTNFTGAVALTLDNPLAGISGQFAPASTTGNSSVLTLSVAASVAPGNYQVTIKGSATGPGDRTTVLALTVLPVPDYVLSLNPSALSVQAGNSDVATVNIARTNFTGAVTLSLSNPPAGITADFAPPSPTGNSSIMTLTVQNTVLPGVYPITVMGTATGVPTRIFGPTRKGSPTVQAAAGDRTTTLQLTVTTGSSISLSASPATVQALQGGIANSTLTITRVSFANDVDLSASGMPPGMGVSFNPDPATGTASAVTVIVGAGVPLGSHQVTLTGTGTGVSNAQFVLTVQVSAPPPVFNADLKFPGAAQPEYVAFRNGGSGWQPVLPLYDAGTDTYSYRMNMTAGYGGVYTVLANAGLAGAMQMLSSIGLIGPEDFAGAAGGMIARRLRQAARMYPITAGSRLTIQSYGTPSELNALNQYFVLGARVNTLASVINGLPRTTLWLGGRYATWDGSQAQVDILDVSASRLQYGMVASRFNSLNVLDAVHVKTSAGSFNTMDMQGAGSAAPLFTNVFFQPPLGQVGTFSHLWRNGNFVGVVDLQDLSPAASPRIVGAPQLAQWGTGGMMGITIYDTDDLTFKRKFTGYESNWNAKSTGFPALFNPNVTNTNGYTVNFSAPTEFGLPFQAFAGTIFPQNFDGNMVVGTATRSYFQLSGQSGPNYVLPYITPATAGAPPGSELGPNNYGIFGVTRSAAVRADGILPQPNLGSVHTQTLRMLSVGYP